MNSNDWELVMNRMLDSFANQAVLSLREINQCFEAMGRPFDDDFRKYFSEVLNQRLDICFKTVLFSKGPLRSNETENSTNHPSATKKQSLNLMKEENDVDSIEICDSDDEDHLNARPDRNAESMQHGPAFGHSNEAKPFVQAEPNCGSVDNSGSTMIEIYESDDEEQLFKVQTNADVNESQAEMNESVAAAMQNVSNISTSNDDAADVVHTGESGNAIIFKVEMVDDSTINDFDYSDDDEHPGIQAAIDLAMSTSNGSLAHCSADQNAASESKPVVIPMLECSPNKESESVLKVIESGESSGAQQKAPSSSTVGNGLKSIGSKRFKCDLCESSFEAKSTLNKHQRIHADGKLLGMKADSNGLYHCTLCVRAFPYVKHLSQHMKSHVDNQRLYYCARCMYQFDRKAQKDRHERQCEGRHYECHLCKYASRTEEQMQGHLRMHTGERPFHCTACNKAYTRKANLEYHWRCLHSRIHP